MIFIKSGILKPDLLADRRYRKQVRCSRDHHHHHGPILIEDIVKDYLQNYTGLGGKPQSASSWFYRNKRKFLTMVEKLLLN